MSDDFAGSMHEAMRLTQAGGLQEATRLIQAVLRRKWGGASDAPMAGMGTPHGPTLDVIDVLAREIPSGTPSPRPTAEPAPTPRPSVGPVGAPPTAVQSGFFPGHHEGPAGQRAYKLFVPPGAGTRPMPLVVMLHGCTQDPDDFAAGTAMNKAAAAQGFFVLYPAQSAKANPQRCWNWFKHNHQSRGRGEPAILAGMTQQILTQHNIEADRVYVAGLSAGGAMAAILGAAYPDIYAAVGVHSGLAAGSAIDLPSALAAMQGAGKPASGAPSGMPTIVFHGDADATVHPNNGATVIASSVARGTEADQRVVHGPNGRSSTRTTYRRHDGHTVAEHWVVHGGAHAWSGGCANGSYTDARGPDATTAMLTFFFQHRRDSASVFRRQASGQSA